MSSPSSEQLHAATQAVLANFNPPDLQHSTWWLNTEEVSTAVYDALHPAMYAMEEVVTLPVGSIILDDEGTTLLIAEGGQTIRVWESQSGPTILPSFPVRIIHQP